MNTTNLVLATIYPTIVLRLSQLKRSLPNGVDVFIRVPNWRISMT
jgi:hypothetical protein